MPEMLPAFGRRSEGLLIRVSKLRRVSEKHQRLKPESITHLPDPVSNLFIVIRQGGGQRTGNFLFVTDHVPRDGEVVVVSAARSVRDHAGSLAAVVAAICGKDRFDDKVLTAQERGQILYLRGEHAGSGY